MAKFWDISPPKRKTKPITPSVKKRIKSNVSWLFFLTLIGAFFIVFAGASKMPQYSEQVVFSTASPNLSAQTPSKSSLKIKLINGTGLFEEKDKALTILLANNYKVNIAENALNTYPETIIYYTTSSENYTKEIETILKNYKPKSTKLSKETEYDLIIVIGKNYFY